MNAMEKLLEITSTPICLSKPDLTYFNDKAVELDYGVKCLTNLLSVKNGFFAFENALLIFPSKPYQTIPGLIEWNLESKWRRYYDHLQSNIIFFAEDLFSCQFGLTPKNIIRLEPETGEITVHSTSLEEWAQKIISDYDYETGWSVGKEWQEKNGPLPVGSRLLGKVPFVLGGDFVSENLVAVEAFEAMEKLGSLFKQIKNVPDGKKIKIRGWIE
jgi:hypothetical protein